MENPQWRVVEKEYSDGTIDYVLQSKIDSKWENISNYYKDKRGALRSARLHNRTDGNGHIRETVIG